MGPALYLTLQAQVMAGLITSANNLPVEIVWWEATDMVGREYCVNWIKCLESSQRQEVWSFHGLYQFSDNCPQGCIDNNIAKPHIGDGLETCKARCYSSRIPHPPLSPRHLQQFCKFGVQLPSTPQFITLTQNHYVEQQIRGLGIKSWQLFFPSHLNDTTK